MKKIFTLLAAAFVSFAANAQGTYAVQETADVTPAGTKITSVPNITMTYGVSGEADFKGGKAFTKWENTENTYVAFCEGNGVNGTATGGTVYYFEPTKNGSLEVAYVLNASKPFFITEDGVALAEYNGIKLAAKAYTATTFNVKAGSKYAVYCTGSKLGFAGFTYTLAPAKNTVKAGNYIAQVTIAGANGVTPPDAFKAYVGTHKFGMDLAGDEEKMTIAGLFILNNFEIVGDAIAYDATKTFTMNDKEFTLCSADGTKKEGSLAVKKNEDGSISIEDFGFMFSGIFAGTAKNISAVIPEYVEAEANITFEDVDLQGATYYNGADDAGLIATAGDFSFMNYYDAVYQSWNGFAISGTRSNIYTGDWSDDTQYNSCVAGGMQSEKFAVGYYSEYNVLMDEEYPEIYATKNIKPEYVYITNTAWTYKSMTEGDDYAKKFDETDWLKLTISGMVFDEEEEDYVAQGSVDFYLAKDGKIVNEWTKVDLTPLGVCEFIRFSMSSSDSGTWGMNTPSYFALDNMKASSTDDEVTTSIKGIKDADKQAVKAAKLVKDGQIIIMKNGKMFNAAGALVK